MGKVKTSTEGATGAIEGAGNAAEVAAKQSEEIEKALEDVGLSAEGAVTDIEKWTQALFNAGLLSLSASDANIAYQDVVLKLEVIPLINSNKEVSLTIAQVNDTVIGLPVAAT